MSKQSKKSKLPLIKKLIRLSAKANKVKPYQVDKVQFHSESAGQVTEWDLRKLGGFEAVKSKLFEAPAKKSEAPKPKNPLASEEAQKLTGHQLSAYIASVITECSEAIAIAPHELTWHEFRNFINMKYGENDKGIARYTITRAGGFNAIRDAYFPAFPTQVMQDKQRLKDHANLNRRLGLEYAKQQFIIERVEDFADRVFKGRIKVDSKLIKKTKPTERIVNAVLSDLHIGSDIDSDETGGLAFGRVEEARRLAAIGREIASYKRQYRDETELELLLLGDVIQNQLHDLRDGAVLAEQSARAIHLLSQLVAYLAGNFKKVRVRCATGNHGRITSRHRERATNQKWDSIETIIYVSVQAACSHLKNVEFFIPKTPFVTYDVFGKKVFATHGDTVLNPGNPAKTISIGTLETQANRINSALNDQDEYSVFVVGHVHTASMTFMGNGSVMITNGAMVPPDQFATSIGIMESQAGQWIWESVEGFAVGDSRFIKVDQKTDKDASLDKIIRPWTKL